MKITHGIVLFMFIATMFHINATVAEQSSISPLIIAAKGKEIDPPPCGKDGMCNAAACQSDPDCPDGLPAGNSPSSHKNDKIAITGGLSDVNPAVLVSGRFEDENGSKRCRDWVSYATRSSSISATINNIGNWIGNAAFDGCNSEVAVFSESGAAQLTKPENRWSKEADYLGYVVGPPIKIPTAVWVVNANRSYADEKTELINEFDIANNILKESRCGIVIDPINYHNNTSTPLNPNQKLGCKHIDTILKPMIGYRENRMNVYIVNQLQADDRSGVACRAESDNVIILDQGRFETSLIHEYGHWFDLWHTTAKEMPLVNAKNIMSMVDKRSRNMMTAGQCYRANFSKNSYINIQGLRTGKTKNCKHLQDADNQCPGLKNEF